MIRHLLFDLKHTVKTRAQLAQGIFDIELTIKLGLNSHRVLKPCLFSFQLRNLKNHPVYPQISLTMVQVIIFASAACNGFFEEIIIAGVISIIIAIFF